MPSQRSFMCSLVEKFGYDEDRVVREYALAEERGEISRKSNGYGTSSDKYARALWSDGVRKGWLTNGAAIPSGQRRQPKRKTASHSWSDSDNLIAYCLYRLGNNSQTLGVDPSELGNILGMGFNSLNLKVANFKAIDGLGGMDGYSRQAEKIQERYSKLSDVELRVIGIEAVQRALDEYTNGT